MQGNTFKIKNHTNIEDRVLAAQLLVEKVPDSIPILVDTMSDEANLDFGALPERLFIIKDGVVEYVGGVGPFLFNPKQVREWLHMFRQSRKD